jgi:hypothetical protein
LRQNKVKEFAYRFKEWRTNVDVSCAEEAYLSMYPGTTQESASMKMQLI